MTEIEAIKELKEDISLYDNEITRLDASTGTPDRNLIDALEMAIQALEKQIPKKIEIRKATNDDIESELRDFITVKGRICRCPSCRCCIHISKLKYCWECGQKLDWSDEE